MYVHVIHVYIYIHINEASVICPLEAEPRISSRESFFGNCAEETL